MRYILEALIDVQKKGYHLQLIIGPYGGNEAYCEIGETLSACAYAVRVVACHAKTRKTTRVGSGSGGNKLLLL